MEQKSIFRKKSLERISSPEQLNDYIRVANPSLWFVLAAIIVLLIGVCVWGFLGKLETCVSGAVIVNDGVALCYVSEDDISSIESGMTVRIGDSEYTVQSISQEPVAISSDSGFSDYFLYISGFYEGEWVYVVTLDSDGQIADGIYSAGIVVDSVSPISFVLN